MVSVQGETVPFIRNVFTLDTCAPIVGSDVLCFQTEKELLQVAFLVGSAGEVVLSGLREGQLLIFFFPPSVPTFLPPSILVFLSFSPSIPLSL